DVSSRTVTFTVTVAGAAAAHARSTDVDLTAKTAAPAYQPEAKLSVTEGPRATAITVDGSGFAPNETVTGSFCAGLTATTLHANADGVVSGETVSVPGAATPGVTGVTLTGADSGVKVELPFTVTK